MAFGRPDATVNAMLFLSLSGGIALIVTHAPILVVMGFILVSIGAAGIFLAYGIGMLVLSLNLLRGLRELCVRLFALLVKKGNRDRKDRDNR